jgi:hypothetical protein
VAYTDLQARIADELSRADLLTPTTEQAALGITLSPIQLEIAAAIEWYQYESFPWTEASTAVFQTVQGQRYYPLPANFLRDVDALSQIGNYTYKLEGVTEQYLDRLDWGTVFWTSYPILFSLWENQIRLFPPPQGNLPVQVKGIISQLPLMTATKTWAANTNFTAGDTVTDSYGNVEQATNTAMSGSGPTWPTATTPGTGIGSAPVPPTVGATTIDGGITWKLIGTTSNVWTQQAEELIRSRALKNLYARYIRDTDQAMVMQKLEEQALQNMQYKNVGRIAVGRIRSVF